MQTIEFKSTTIIKHHSIHISGEIEFNLICQRDGSDGSDSGVSADHRQNPPETTDAAPQPVSSEETSAPQPETSASSEEPQTEASTAPDTEARDPEERGEEGEEGDLSGCEKSSGN
jgi:hypothetical protein